MDPYQVLGLDKTANDEEVKQAFRKKALEYHPDRSTQDSVSESKQKFVEVVKAYEILKQPEKRLKVDKAQSEGRTFSDEEIDRKPDPLGERFARYWQEVQEVKKQDQRKYTWTDQQALDWEEALRDAELVKARSIRKRALWQAAHSKRIAKALGKH
eukprot:TRINITY_DN4137_c0_g1_i20.p3 TRINITY_DN4137_c0_g1~~TRINITY_DN4137_c0_g1_i20.p3  ORF type:complete len:177 (-),score=31.14 TRINITY_DN4137_c0_g1_i20:398-865(-)